MEKPVPDFPLQQPTTPIPGVLPEEIDQVDTETLRQRERAEVLAAGRRERKGLWRRIVEYPDKFIDQLTDKDTLDDFAQYVMQMGWLPPEVGAKALESIDNNEAYDLLRLWPKLNFYSTVMDAFFGSLGGGVGVGVGVGKEAATNVGKGVGVGFGVYALSHLIQGPVKYIISRRHSDNIRDIKRKALVFTIPFIGVHAPLYYLFRDHPELTRVYNGFRHARRAYKALQKIEDKNSLRYRQLEGRVQQQFFRGYQQVDRIYNGVQWVKDRVNRVVNFFRPRKKRTPAFQPI